MFQLFTKDKESLPCFIRLEECALTKGSSRLLSQKSIARIGQQSMPLLPLSLFVLFCYATLRGSVQRPISEQGRLFLFSLHMFWPVISIHSAILGDMAIYDTTGTYSSSHNGLCVPHCQRPFFLITLKNLPFRNTPAWQTTCAPSDRRARLVLGSRFATPCAERVHLHLLIPTPTPSPIPLPPPRSDGRNSWYDGLFLAEAWFPGFLQLLEVIISRLGTAPHSMGLVFRLLAFSWTHYMSLWSSSWFSSLSLAQVGHRFVLTALFRPLFNCDVYFNSNSAVKQDITVHHSSSHQQLMHFQDLDSFLLEQHSQPRGDTVAFRPSVQSRITALA